MAQRTYIHALIDIAHTLCKYMVRYQSQIMERLSVDQAAAFTALLTACIAFNAIIGDKEQGD